MRKWLQLPVVSMECINVSQEEQEVLADGRTLAPQLQ
jgi:hypothetical protein